MADRFYKEKQTRPDGLNLDLEHITVQLTTDNCVVIKIEAQTRYEAALLYDDFLMAVEKGGASLSFLNSNKIEFIKT